MARSRNTADTQTASGGPVSPFVVGKNVILNGDFSIWNRGTSVALGGYGADRFRATGIGNFSRQTFTPGTAPVAGYEGQYFGRWNLTSNSQNYDFGQRVENARTFAGQTVTLSFWAKASATTSNAFFPRIFQNFGTGGSPSSAVYTDSSNINLTTSWTRYTITLAIPSVSGKTFGTANDSYLGVIVQCNTTSVVDIDFWGWQLETGSVATPFQTATGTIPGELAACQRYYFRTQTGTGTPYICNTVAGSSTTTYANLIHKVTMRSSPTSVEFSAIKWQAINNSGNITAASISDATPENTLFVCTTTGATAAQMNYVIGQTTSGYMAVSAEL